jgi:hypothetical protein
MTSFKAYGTIGISLGVTALVAFVLWFVPYASFETHRAIAFFSFFALLLTLPLEQWSPMYVLRFFLLAGSGFIPSALLFFVAEGSMVMNYAIPLQSRPMAGYVLLLAVLALAGNAMGWRMGTAFFQRHALRVPLIDDAFSEERKSFYSVCFCIFAFISATLLSLSLGPFVWEASYSQQSSAQLFGMQAYNLLCTLSLLVLLAINVTDRFRSLKSVLTLASISLYALFFSMLFRGMRAEVVGTVFGSFVMLCAFYRKKVSGLIVVGALSGGMLFVYLWGTYRATAASGFGLSDAFSFMTQRAVSYDDFGNYIYQTGTFGDISATLYNAVALVQSQAVELLHGKSYWDFIPRTLPVFLYPDRPRDLSFVFYEMDRPYGGGIFELAEAYLNFGSVGCFIVPLAISLVLGGLYQMAWLKPTLLRLVICAVFAGSIFRGTLYQSFVFYRAVTVVAVFILGVEIFYRLLRRKPNVA